MRTMDGDFHPERKIPDGCLSSPFHHFSLSFISLTSCECCRATCTGYFSSSPVLSRVEHYLRAQYTRPVHWSF